MWVFQKTGRKTAWPYKPPREIKLFKKRVYEECEMGYFSQVVIVQRA